MTKVISLSDLGPRQKQRGADKFWTPGHRSGTLACELHLVQTMATFCLMSYLAELWAMHKESWCWRTRTVKVVTQLCTALEPELCSKEFKRQGLGSGWWAALSKVANKAATPSRTMASACREGWHGHIDMDIHRWSGLSGIMLGPDIHMHACPICVTLLCVHTHECVDVWIWWSAKNHIRYIHACTWKHTNTCMFQKWADGAYCFFSPGTVGPRN